MKRKFLSALMFGALIASSAALTSCKDYDDDINGLRTDVTTVQKALTDAKSDLQGKIDALKSQLEAKDAELTTKINNLATANDEGGFN